MVAAANLERAGPRLARRLVLDELFDLSLYRSLRGVAPPDLRRVLEQLIPIETRHFRFWQDFFGLRVENLITGGQLGRHVAKVVDDNFLRSVGHNG
jgi:hypothetical protein